MKKRNTRGNQKVKKKIRIRAAYIVAAVCLLAAGALLCHFFEFGVHGQGTRLAFNIDNPAGNGFSRDLTVYTENGITRAAFSGRITVDGTAEITVAANEDGGVVYRESYTDLKSKTIEFVLDDLKPYAYYTLRFASDDSKGGHLLLVTDESLVERPERAARPEHSPPSHS
ncbi:hypothetical protein CE91St41_23240 [Oscillospiraceae bacterium]|nr:hypothetical protein CE91St40_14300 [Oscillospiraceae bacterium]BDF75435.1 hypothetical protein CE91St41_23240 [Oscillospiraceae bacterium]